MQIALDSLLEVALAQPLCTSASVREEGNKNLFYLSFTEAEVTALTIAAIQEWVEAVLAGKRRQLLAHQGHHYPMQFYCWHDAQASQLRFSLVSAASVLPFSCAVRFVELPVVVQEFLAQQYSLFDKNLFELDSATAQLAVAQAAAEAFVLSVWHTIIP